MKVTVGYGWRKPQESLEEALSSYNVKVGIDEFGTLGDKNNSLKEAQDDYKQGIEDELISNDFKPVFFKVELTDLE